MKPTFHHILLVAGAFCLLTACSKEELAVPAADNAQRLSITIADGGYASADAPRTTSASRRSPSDAPATRATENGYTTNFTAGDACGLYIVRDGRVMAANIKLTASAATDGTRSGASLVWTPDASAGTLYYGPADRYFLYYPWQSAPMGSPAEGAEFAPSGTGDADAEFFATMIGAWKPVADQSDYENYTASDLMTSEGTAGVSSGGAVPLAFPMTHRMALAVVELPGTVYKFTGTTIPDYTATAVAFEDEKRPFLHDGTYRYLVHPVAGAELTATYDDGTQHEFTVSIAGNSLAAGSYKTYKVDGGKTEKSYTLQIGDFYCTKDNGTSGYVIPQEVDAAIVQSATVVGIVFQTDKSRIGHAEKDALKAKGINEPHGLVMAVKNTGKIKQWSSETKDFDELTNCKTQEDCNNDISGLHNYNTVVTYAGKNDRLSEYPAFDAIYKWNAKDSKHKAPENTTGWYLPAVGQWYDFFANLGGLQDWSGASLSDDDDYYWSRQSELLSKVNAHFSPLGDGNYDAFMPDTSYESFWSSSEYSDSSARYWGVNSFGHVYCHWGRKSYAHVVRPVLAF